MVTGHSLCSCLPIRNFAMRLNAETNALKPDHFTETIRRMKTILLLLIELIVYVKMLHFKYLPYLQQIAMY